MRIGTWCGSLGEGSANAVVLTLGQQVLADRGVETIAIGGLEAIEPFRADRAVHLDDAPAGVAAFRHAVESVDGLLVAAPEYAGGVAGVAKNALDWLVGSGSLYHRVVGVASAGTTGGGFAIEHLVRTISWQGGLVVATLAVASPRTKQDATGAFTDAATIADIRDWAGAVADAVVAAPADRLARVAPIVTPLGIDLARFGDLG